MEVALGQGHGGVEADDRKQARDVQDGLDDLLADRRIEEVELGGVVPRHAGAVVAVSLLAGTHVELDRDVAERQFLAKDVEQVTLVSRVEERGAVDEEDDGRRGDADLGGVIDPRRAVLARGRRMGLDGLADDPVERAGAHSLLRLLEERLRQVHDRLDVLAGLGRDERHGHVAHRAERMLDEIGESAHVALRGVGRVVQHQVPLIDREDARLVFLGDVIGQLLVEPGDALGGVEEQQDDVGAADRPLGAVDRVKVEVVADLGVALDSGGVDRQERHAVELELNVDRVAGRSRPLGDDHPLGPRQGVDQGGLAGVGPADHGDLHHGVGRLDRRRWRGASRRSTAATASCCGSGGRRRRSACLGRACRTRRPDGRTRGRRPCSSPG